ncbi:hypothetical protein AOLI_G00299500 [Acnodon oligacanthus]
MQHDMSRISSTRRCSTQRCVLKTTGKVPWSTASRDSLRTWYLDSTCGAVRPPEARLDAPPDVLQRQSPASGKFPRSGSPNSFVPRLRGSAHPGKHLSTQTSVCNPTARTRGSARTSTCLQPRLTAGFSSLTFPQAPGSSLRSQPGSSHLQLHAHHCQRGVNAR